MNNVDETTNVLTDESHPLNDKRNVGKNNKYKNEFMSNMILVTEIQCDLVFIFHFKK